MQDAARSGKEDDTAAAANDQQILSELGAAALEYAERGWHVFPLTPGTKVPLKGTEGQKNASNDPETVGRWWTQNPTANIGLHLARSGLVAIDPDTYKPECAWLSFIQGKEIPPPLEQSTPRGGRHYIFQASEGAKYPGTLCEAVDVKHNGYVLLEPSVVGGKPYRFETDDDPAPCPEWVPLKGHGKEHSERGKTDEPAGDNEVNATKKRMAIAALNRAPNDLV